VGVDRQLEGAGLAVESLEPGVTINAVPRVRHVIYVEVGVIRSIGILSPDWHGRLIGIMT
jgi:hypothetical protein